MYRECEVDRTALSIVGGRFSLVANRHCRMGNPLLRLRSQGRFFLFNEGL